MFGGMQQAVLNRNRKNRQERPQDDDDMGQGPSGPRRYEGEELKEVTLKRIADLYDLSKSRKREYVELFAFLAFSCFYLAILFLQRQASVSYEVFYTLENGLVPADVNDDPREDMSDVGLVYEWLGGVIGDVWTEPNCGDGTCQYPFEFPQYGRFGCSLDCGLWAEGGNNVEGLAMTAQSASLRFDITVDFNSDQTNIPYTRLMSMLTWNLCPVPGTALHGDSCWYEVDQAFVEREATYSFVLDDVVPDGFDELARDKLAEGTGWELRVRKDYMFKTRGKVTDQRVYAANLARAALRERERAAQDNWFGQRQWYGTMRDFLSGDRVNDTVLGVNFTSSGDLYDEFIAILGQAPSAIAIDQVLISQAASAEDATVQNILASLSDYENTANARVSEEEALAADDASCELRSTNTTDVEKVCTSWKDIVDADTIYHVKMVPDPFTFEAHEAYLEANPDVSELDLINDPTNWRGGAQEFARARACERGPGGESDMECMCQMGTFPQPEFCNCTMLFWNSGDRTGLYDWSPDFDKCVGYVQTLGEPYGDTGLAPRNPPEERRRLLEAHNRASVLSHRLRDLVPHARSMGAEAAAAADELEVRGRKLLQDLGLPELTSFLQAALTDTGVMADDLIALQADVNLVAEIKEAAAVDLATLNSIFDGFGEVDILYGRLNSLTKQVQGTLASNEAAAEAAEELRIMKAEMNDLYNESLGVIDRALEDAHEALRSEYEVYHASEELSAGIDEADPASYGGAAWLKRSLEVEEFRAWIQRRNSFFAGLVIVDSTRVFTFPLDYYELEFPPNATRSRKVGTSNRVIGGLLVHVERYGEKSCDSDRFASIQSECFAGTTTEPYGVDPVMKLGTPLYDFEMDTPENKDKFYNCAFQAELEGADPASEPYQPNANFTGIECPKLYNRFPTGVPYGFHHYKMAGLPDGYPIVVDVNLGAERASMMHEYMVYGQMIDEYTKRMTTQVVTYNAEMERFGNTLIYMTFTPGGSIMLRYQIQIINVNLYEDPEDFVRAALEVILILGVLASLGAEVFEMYEGYKETGNVFGYFTSVWNYIDVGSIGMQLTTCVMWWIYVFTQSEPFKCRLSYKVYRDNAAPARFAEINYDPDDAAATYKTEFDDMAGMFDDLRQMADFQTVYFTINGVNIILMLARILKCFDFQPRMSLVTQTLTLAGTDLAHFFLVMFIIFLGYAMMANLIFGYVLPEFSTPGLALNECFEMMLGEVAVVKQLDTLTKVEQIPAVLYFWTFNVIVVFILLNFLLAIIVDAFAEVKSNAQSSEAIYEELGGIFSEWFKSVLHRRNWGFKEHMNEDEMHRVLTAVADELQPDQPIVKTMVVSLGEDEITLPELEALLLACSKSTPGGESILPNDRSVSVAAETVMERFGYEKDESKVADEKRKALKLTSRNQLVDSLEEVLLRQNEILKAVTK